MRNGLLFLIVFFVVGSGLSTSYSSTKGGGLTGLVTAVFSGKLFKKRKPEINIPLIQHPQEKPKKLEEQQFDVLNDSSKFGTLKRVSTQSDGDMEISFKKDKFDKGKGKKQKSLGELFSKKEQEKFDLELDKIIKEIKEEAKKGDNL